MTSKSDEWPIVGWVNRANVDYLSVVMSDGSGGLFRLDSFEKMLSGAVKGVPIKRPAGR